ncbi:hypothetical protein MNBD_GAMMA10-541 [hydrothermal vent metagenome]|uniref:DUF3592 domain-containing protein n=1 Tax=hydrothermal vent metagenome TaxID=652676 RepID=A0A3B0Y5G1_9ZZZZ
MNFIEYIPLVLWSTVFLILFLNALFSLYKSLKASFWPEAQGEIINLQINEEKDSEGDSFYTTNTRYRYTVDNITYQSSRLAYGLDSWAFLWLTSGAFKEAAKYYPNVIVKYNPKWPNEATLVTGIKRFHIASLLLFSGFGLMPLYSLDR